MAVVLNTRFNDALAVWDYKPLSTCGATTAQPHLGYGIDDQYAIVCSSGENAGVNENYVGRQFFSLGGQGYPIFSWRGQYGFYCTAPASIPVIDANDFLSNSSSIGSHFSLVLELDVSGGVGTQNFVLNYNGISQATSAAGVVPLDGTVHGLVVNFNLINPTHITVEVFVDDVSVLSHTVTIGGSDGGFRQILLYHSRYPQCGQGTPGGPGHGPAIEMTTCAECICEDALFAGSYLPSNAHQIGEFTCWQQLTVTDLAIDCDANTLTITGTNFINTPVDVAPVFTSTCVGEMEIIVQDYEGISVPFTVVSRTNTQIVLHLTNPFRPGKVCVTVTKGCDSAV